MDTTIFIFIMGTLFGAAIVAIAAFFVLRQQKLQFEQRLSETEARAASEQDTMAHKMKETFNSLSLEALSRNTEEFFKLATQNFNQHKELSEKDLSGKKDMIDQTFKSMKEELGKVGEMVQTIEKDRKAKFDVLSGEIARTAKETRTLRETADELKSALTNSRVRGQWGERMAEDVLRLAGFIEGTNYLKQQTLAEDGGRPDYTFYLPDNHVVHMDVKFPLENYLNYMNAESDIERDRFRTQFLKDARVAIDEVTKRNYVDPAGGTLDYVMVFIPNEQVYAFINEQDRDLLDNALSKKIILCSPTTLYAVLAVIRQALDNFHMERKAGEILNLLESFHKQWDKFVEAMDKVSRQMDTTQKSFAELTGTRRRMLERPLSKIEELKSNERLVESGSGQKLKVINLAGEED